MAEVEEPQFTSLSARIAALNQQGVGKSLGAVHQPHPTGKRPPPPLPSSSSTRPGILSRGQTTNNPPISTYGSSSSKQANNLPIGVKGTALLPPPPVDRDHSQSSNTNNARTPPLPARRGPPPLPTRKDSQPSPALPPRKSSTQLARRGSNESAMSYSSTISSMSLSQAGSTNTNASSVDSARKLPPALNQAKLPPLPPSRREREQAEAEERRNPPKVPLTSIKSSPNIPIRQPPVVDRDLPPKMPPRPSGPPRMPSRPTNFDNVQEEEEKPPQQPPRRLPPPNSTRSALSMGFSNRSNETPNPGLRPTPTFTRTAGPVVQELNDRNFDSVVMTGKAVFVDFYTTYCKYCVELDPVWKQVAEDFSFASDKLVFAKVDVGKYKTFLSRFGIQSYPTLLFFDGRSETPQKYQFARQAKYLSDYVEEQTGISADDAPKSNGVPPPINMSSKPSRSQVQAVQSRPAPAAPPTSGCLICRDFSGPDQVAAQHPRHSLPQTGDATGYLANVLCGPFTSATDKARAIFTWLHHNIAYDTAAFFGNRVKHVDPKDTIASGLAVCGGYAGVYTAIALKAGLEAVMVTGHGKGYGYTAPKPGEQCPPCNPAGHAWNAVRIDGGEWKLLDSCWGAGNVGNQVFNKKFTPSYFTMSNDDFGIKHFPQDRSHFFRSDGSVPSWEEYYLGAARAEPLQIYGSVEDHGISPVSITPPQKRLPINGETVRFQFSKVCEHWDFEKNGEGKPYPLVLKINGLDGRNEDYVAMENNDFWWWADISARDLGAPGQTVSCYAVTSVNGKDARGMTRREYLNKKGRSGMGFAGVCAWELV
ncbi:Protein disulfide-isomerase [Lachnellula subtilissima]|uniref:Protein disulfide-isomerase n=1 Tax=Lachnellula subtilissima TaxID=602034 RepID=A0A8H8RSE1_9HELO|nr:Protein disulfide-isomerase [Lachnellula subtilissima]